VSDGKKYWVYTPPFDSSEHGQVIIKKASEVKSKLATLLLSGQFSSNRDTDIKADGPHHYVILPKKGTAGDVEEASIDVDEKKLLIEKVGLKYKNGNVVNLVLKNIRLGENAPDKMFNFVVPAHTDEFKE